MTGIADEFAWYADWAADISPLYECLARGVAEDPQLQTITQDTKKGQPAPQLLLGAVHAILLRGVDHPLADFYPTCTDTPIDPNERDPFPSFREFCFTYENQIREIISSRRVQTNEVGRSAVLLPAFEYVARSCNRAPLALIEIGASAGLNLCWDRYCYKYDEYGTYGDHNSSVTIKSTLRGNTTPPFPEYLPEIVYRVGNDINPLDVTDPDDARWLRALVIPDQRTRHQRLSAAIEVARRNPPKIVEGDAIETVGHLIDQTPETAVICIFSTLTLYQLQDKEIADIREIFIKRSQNQPIHWLSGDPSAENDHPTYRHVGFHGSTFSETQLAEYESYGEWIRWIGEEKSGNNNR
ncbi:MAG: DUF2332 domain-containing protein [Halobacteriaceae archaeon]